MSRNEKGITSYVTGAVWGYLLGNLVFDLYSLNQGNKPDLFVHLYMFPQAEGSESKVLIHSDISVPVCWCPFQAGQH